MKVNELISILKEVDGEAEVRVKIPLKTAEFLANCGDNGSFSIADAVETEVGVHANWNRCFYRNKAPELPLSWEKTIELKIEGDDSND